jgi:hypothetical protein
MPRSAAIWAGGVSSFSRAWWMGAGSVRAGSAPGQVVAVTQSSGGCQCRGSPPIPHPSSRRRAWPASAVARLAGMPRAKSL